MMKMTHEVDFRVSIQPCYDLCHKIGSELGWKTIEADRSNYVLKWQKGSNNWISRRVYYITISMRPSDTLGTHVTFTMEDTHALYDLAGALNKQLIQLFEPFRARIVTLPRIEGPVSEGFQCPTCGKTFAAGTQFCPIDGTPISPDQFHKKFPLFCISCGAQLPDEANFCLKCGKPQKAIAQADSFRWETCEIIFVQLSAGLGGAKGYFEAKAIGPNGTYSAGVGQTFGAGFGTWAPDATNPKVVGLHNVFIDQLVGEGWEPSGDRGTDWWNQRFRRRIK